MLLGTIDCFVIIKWINVS